MFWFICRRHPVPPGQGVLAVAVSVCPEVLEAPVAVLTVAVHVGPEALEVPVEADGTGAA